MISINGVGFEAEGLDVYRCVGFEAEGLDVYRCVGFEAEGLDVWINIIL